MFIDKELEIGKEALMIVADFTPLNLSTMTKFEKQGTVCNHHLLYCCAGSFL